MQRLYKLSPFKLAILFWTGACLLYGIAWRSGFERDFEGWFEMFNKGSFGDIINRKGTHITSLYQVTQFQLWCWTKLFGQQLVPWFLLLTGLHAAATSMVVVFTRKLYADFGWKGDAAIAFWGGLFFLIAPSGAEVVVWKACYHYPVAVLLCFGIWGLLRKALLEGKGLPVLCAVALYALSTFTLELFYATLPLAFLLLVFYRRQAIPHAFRRVALFGLLPMFFLFVGHFVLYHALYGNYIPHTEGLVKSAIEKPLPTLGRALQYEFHLLLQGRYWPSEWRSKIYPLLETTKGGLLALLLFAGSGAVLLWKWVRTKKGAPALWLLAGATLGMVLILPIGVIDWGIYYNDRHLYFTGLFQWQLLAVVLVSFTAVARKAGLALVAVVLTALAFYTAVQCRRSATVFWKVLENFPLLRSKVPVVLLNVPANLGGIVLFQEGPGNGEFNAHLQVFRGDSVKSPMQSVAGYGMDAQEDGVRVFVKSRGEMVVSIIKPGPWYWNTTVGASNHETDLYSIKLDEWTHQYTMQLKDTTARTFYFNNLQWKEADYTIRDREQE